MPIICALDNLDRSSLVRILKEPKNSIYNQYKKLFSLDGVDFEIEENAFEAIADMAIERQIGARGLRSIIEGIMMKPMYEIPSQADVAKVIITKDYVLGKAELPQIIKKAI